MTDGRGKKAPEPTKLNTCKKYWERGDKRKRTAPQTKRKGEKEKKKGRGKGQAGLGPLPLTSLCAMKKAKKGILMRSGGGSGAKGVGKGKERGRKKVGKKEENWQAKDINGGQ